MIGLATTRCSLLSGTTTDAYGDEVDSATTVVGWTDFPASIIERSRSLQDPSTGTWRTQSYLVARVPQNLPAAIGDRIGDNRTGITYVIDDFTTTPRGIGGSSSLTLEIRQTSA